MLYQCAVLKTNKYFGFKIFIDCDKTEKIENNTDLEDVLENNEYKTGKAPLPPPSSHVAYKQKISNTKNSIL